MHKLWATAILGTQKGTIKEARDQATRDSPPHAGGAFDKATVDPRRVRGNLAGSPSPHRAHLAAQPIVINNYISSSSPSAGRGRNEAPPHSSPPPEASKSEFFEYMELERQSEAEPDEKELFCRVMQEKHVSLSQLREGSPLTAAWWKEQGIDMPSLLKLRELRQGYNTAKKAGWKAGKELP
ncbi:hypothetical protein JCM10213_005906 [Rhodosporidiobolus nylandii]